MSHSFIWTADVSETCPRCKHEIEKGDLVHWYNDALWHRIKPFTEDECET